MPPTESLSGKVRYSLPIVRIFYISATKHSVIYCQEYQVNKQDKGKMFRLVFPHSNFRNIIASWLTNALLLCFQEEYESTLLQQCVKKQVQRYLNGILMTVCSCGL